MNGTWCHTLRMVSYTIVPRGRGYWIIANDTSGKRRPMERFDTEDKAVRRLRELQELSGTVERRTILLQPKKRH